MKAFETFVDDYMHNGFKMSFENGFTISVQFHASHRCDGGNTTAEVAIWDNDNNWYLFSDGTWQKMPAYTEVMSYQTSEQVANLIKQTSIK